MENDVGRHLFIDFAQLLGSKGGAPALEVLLELQLELGIAQTRLLVHQFDLRRLCFSLLKPFEL